MIVVTGAAGFIGSNLVEGLNGRGESRILAVDDMTDGKKMFNLADLQIADYEDRDDFLDRIDAGEDMGITAVFHQGACSTTTEWDGRYMMQNNYSYSKKLLHYCLEREIPFLYASSASVYGSGPLFEEDPYNESPINVYAYSKCLFDQYVRSLSLQQDDMHNSQVVGLRYFNVYGPREQHKGGMASVAYHFNNQIKDTGVCRLFEGSDGYDDGEQRRDFIYVGDVVKLNLWLLDHPSVSGIYNCGTGRSQTFNDVANAVIAWHGEGEIEYVPFPEHLKGSYQSFTEADLSHLRDSGYDGDFRTVEEGVTAYLDILNQEDEQG